MSKRDFNRKYEHFFKSRDESLLRREGWLQIQEITLKRLFLTEIPKEIIEDSLKEDFTGASTIHPIMHKHLEWPSYPMPFPFKRFKL